MNKKEFEEKVQQKLKKLSIEQTVHFVWRCAVRALPLLGSSGSFSFWHKKDRQRHIYSIFYALDVSASYATNIADCPIPIAKERVIVEEASVDTSAAISIRAAASAVIATAAAYTTNAIAFKRADAVASAAADDAGEAFYALSDTYALNANAAASAAAAKAVEVVCAAAAAGVQKNLNLEPIILLDLDTIQNNGVWAAQHTPTNVYGEIWDNFQKALDTEGFSYWGKLYKSIFDSGFVLDLKALKRRINVPTEIKDQGTAAVTNYLEKLETQGEGFVYEAKLIIVGEPGAGKTSLSKKLMDSEYVLDIKEQPTKGIDIEKWQFPYSEEILFQCNIWDFGGQEIMKATHRYFLTKRSLYILVADNRKEDANFYYWLNDLELLSEKSPVVIVLNEKHNFKKLVPNDIVKTFDGVQEIVSVNLADNRGLNDLSNSIQQYMRDLPHIGKDPVPKKWVTIRRKLETNNQDYITINDYKKICKENGIKGEEQAGYISEFLHDLGVILHFQKDRILRNTVILNARWAIEAVYRVLLDCTIIKNGGELDYADLIRIWVQPCYLDKHAELIQLMLNFELCYEIEKTQKYIIPELLPNNPSSETAFWFGQEKLLFFEYRYSFMPKGIISGLIVRMNKHIYKRQQWKNGVVLEYGTSRAEIVENLDDRILKVRIVGKDRQDTLAVIRREVNELHDRFANLSVREMVPCNCPECKKAEPSFFDYDELRQYKEEGEQYIKCRVGYIKDVKVLDLISDVIIRKDDEVKGIAVNNNINIRSEGGKAEAFSGSNAKAITNVSVDIKVDLPAIQDKFVELKNFIINTNPELEGQLDKIEDSLDEVTPESDKQELAKPMNKLRRFLEKVADEKSDYNKAIKGVTKGVEIAQNVGKTYNNFAEWLVLPQIPDLFL